ncbi:PEPxxWA-CTERM sorting domain-containing protein [Sphingomonas nostoxanthinifaciens]|nr:PEPxxWA-CTERM sorting domain-containing protein [Sphingomonas nostoxanthinifaciens]
MTVATASARADVIFSDSNFVASDYQVAFASSTGGASLTAAACTSCGDSGTALRLTISDSDGSNLGAAIINSSFTYDPFTQGAITTIDASVDKNFTAVAPPLFGYGNTFRPVIEQGGNFYTAVKFGTSVTVPAGGTTASSGFEVIALSALTAADFSQFDVTTGLVGTAHPDFAGSAITFGIGQVLAASPLSAGSAITVISDFDNLSIAVHTAAVPEPASWALMVAGFGTIGSAMRRRGKKRYGYPFSI